MRYAPCCRLAPALLLLLGACATAGSPSPTSVAPPSKVDGMVDPESGRIRDLYARTGVSLARLVQQRHGRPLDANDRRFIDAAFDAAFRDLPSGPSRPWVNPANGNKGEVDLLVWQPDLRNGELCGVFRHRVRLGTDGIGGTVTLCRAEPDADWRIDTVSFDAPPAPLPVATSPKPQALPAPVPSTAAPAHPTPTAAPSATPAIPPAPVPVEPAPPTVGKTMTTRPQAPPTESGDQNLGDYLQDQAPHQGVP